MINDLKIQAIYLNNYFGTKKIHLFISMGPCGSSTHVSMFDNAPMIDVWHKTIHKKV
jgi:hypothetical protein